MAGRVQTYWRKAIGQHGRADFFSFPFSFAFSLYCYGQLVPFFTLTRSVVLPFIKHTLYASSGACFRCRRADGAMSVRSVPCPEMDQECYGSRLASY